MTPVWDDRLWNYHCGYCRTNYMAVGVGKEAAERWGANHRTFGCEAFKKLWAEAWKPKKPRKPSKGRMKRKIN